ncbi:hypothetical protein [Actinomadura flavalba]|nr:hypothetical protein [Actinomadura flavalba]
MSSRPFTPAAEVIYVAEQYGPDPIGDAWEHLFLDVWTNPAPRSG